MINNLSDMHIMGGSTVAVCIFHLSQKYFQFKKKWMGRRKYRKIFLKKVER